MSIYYRLDRINDNIGDGGQKKQGLYPRVVVKKTIGLRSLCENASRGTTFSAIELEAAVQSAVKEIINELAEGNSVNIEGFGSFSVSAEAAHAAKSGKEIRAESILFKKITFKTSASLPKTMFNFERLPQ